MTGALRSRAVCVRMLADSGQRWSASDKLPGACRPARMEQSSTTPIFLSYAERKTGLDRTRLREAERTGECWRVTISRGSGASPISNFCKEQSAPTWTPVSTVAQCENQSAGAIGRLIVNRRRILTPRIASGRNVTRDGVLRTEHQTGLGDEASSLEGLWAGRALHRPSRPQARSMGQQSLRRRAAPEQ